MIDMNKKEIINTLNRYNFDNNNYIVISGAAMVLYGIKDTTSDIDIAVSDKYYNYLLNKYRCTFDRINEYNEKVYFIDNIINFARTYYPNNKEYINDIPVQSIEKLLELKQYLNRDKDKIDIEKIKKYKGGIR